MSIFRLRWGHSLVAAWRKPHCVQYRNGVRMCLPSHQTQGRHPLLSSCVGTFSLTCRGHGTYVENDTITSSVAGTLERVNKLISVRPLSTRYVPEVGDLVIGRIVEVAGQRWKVEANARQDAVLMLSSVNLPGGVQRRKVESDSLKMREFLAEGDVSVFPPFTRVSAAIKYTVREIAVLVTAELS